MSYYGHAETADFCRLSTSWAVKPSWVTHDMSREWTVSPARGLDADRDARLLTAELGVRVANLELEVVTRWLTARYTALGRSLFKKADW